MAGKIHLDPCVVRRRVGFGDALQQRVVMEGCSDHRSGTHLEDTRAICVGRGQVRELHQGQVDDSGDGVYIN